MPSPEEKQRRWQIARELRSEEIAQARALRPIADQDLVALLEHLDQSLFLRVNEQILSRCDHSFRVCRQFLSSRGLSNIDGICEWFGEYGGFCDCEVAYNVGDYWCDKLADG